MLIKLPKKAILASASTLTPPADAPIDALLTKPANEGKAGRRVRKMLGRIRAAYKSGDRKKAGALVRRYLMSFDARLAAVLRAYGQLRLDRRPPLSLLPSIAGSLNAWAGTQEEVQLRLVPKDDDPIGYRTIVDFGIENRALQYLVRGALTAQSDLHPNQYATRGVHAAIKQVVSLMEQGYVWAIETDIENCYQSFGGKKVSELLPLPKEVTWRSILGEHLSITLLSDVFGSASADEQKLLVPEAFAAARRGLPQGSAASPLVAEMLLATVFDELPEGSQTIGYADNFLVMGKTEHDVCSTTLALWGALEAHPAGQFTPKPKIYKAGTAIDFLGHRLTPLSPGVRIEPTPENCNEFKCRLETGLSELEHLPKYPSAPHHKKVMHLRRYVRSWTAAFSLCTGIGQRRAQALAAIDKLA